MSVSPERLRELKEIGRRKVQQFRDNGVIREIAAKSSSNDTPKTNWNDLDTEGKLSYLLRQLKGVKDQLNPLPNPFEETPTPLDGFILAKEAKLKEDELKAAYKRIKELEVHKDETDERIKRIRLFAPCGAWARSAQRPCIRPPVLGSDGLPRNGRCP